MAKKVTVQVAGGNPQVFSGLNTVEDAREKIKAGDDYSASINGVPADGDEELEDFCYVSFAPNAKGA